MSDNQEYREKASIYMKNIMCYMGEIQEKWQALDDNNEEFNNYVHAVVETLRSLTFLCITCGRSTRDTSEEKEIDQSTTVAEMILMPQNQKHRIQWNEFIKIALAVQDRPKRTEIVTEILKLYYAICGMTTHPKNSPAGMKKETLIERLYFKELGQQLFDAYREHFNNDRQIAKSCDLTLPALISHFRAFSLITVN